MTDTNILDAAIAGNRIDALLANTTSIVVEQIRNTRPSNDELQGLILSVYATLRNACAPAAVVEPIAEPARVFEPAVTVRKSLADPDHIISMIDGKPYKALKRHIAVYGLTPDEYRARYNLPANYPMTAPGYSAKRRALAIENGLGRKPNPASPAVE